MRTEMARIPRGGIKRSIRISVGQDFIEGELEVPSGACGLVLFAHGSGSSRHSPRNKLVASIIRKSGNATLLFDLLTASEEIEDNVTARLRFDIALLARRLVTATRWIQNQPEFSPLGIGYFGSSTGGGAALVAAAQLGKVVRAVVSRGGRPDLAGDALHHVETPTLLIVGEYDAVVLGLNSKALANLRCEKQLKVIPRATHLFEEPGTLDQVAELAAEWFKCHLPLTSQQNN